MSYDAGDRKSVRRAEKESRIADRERREFIASAVRTVAGRKWFYDLLASCHVFVSTYNDVAARSAFAEGERNVGLRLLADLTASEPEALILMLKEHNERSTRTADDRSPVGELSGSPNDRRYSEGRERTDIDAGINDEDRSGDYDLYSEPASGQA